MFGIMIFLNKYFLDHLGEKKKSAYLPRTPSNMSGPWKHFEKHCCK